MPKSRAEIQKLYRLRRDSDPDRRASYLEKEQQKYEKDKESGRKKLVKDMNEREKRLSRREWKRKKDISRDAQKRAAHGTPPETPTATTSARSRQSVSGARMRRKHTNAAYKRIKLLEDQLTQTKRKLESYKKKYQRAVKPQVRSVHDTPRTKTRKLLRCFTAHKRNVRRVLCFHYALVDTIKKRYQDTRLEREKSLYARLITGKLLTKYKFQQLATDSLGFSQRRWKTADLVATHKKRRTTPYCEIKKAVVQFYLRQDISRIMPGKKDAITYKKERQQKRLLTDTLKNIYAKFLAEYPCNKVSYSLFCTLRPFWIVHPSVRDLETCLCKQHENAQFMAHKFYQMGLLKTDDVEKIVESFSCKSDSMECMYGNCQKCKDIKLRVACEDHTTAAAFESCDLCMSNGLKLLKRYDTNEMVFVDQWIMKTEEYDGKECRVTVKDQVQLSMFELIQRFEDMLARIKKHVFNIRHQFLSYRDVRKNLTECECLIHIDFAENYNCKYNKEIQSVHFGGSHKQVTLHTGVLYVGQNDPVSFCTLSDSRQHDPIAIWRYLEPVFDFLKNAYPAVKVVHFFSDGPTTQYRQKKNFFFFCTKLFDLGFTLGTWNFFEASHGKGAADGVGAVLKRTADRMARHGTDMHTPQVVFEKLSLSVASVRLFFVSSEEINIANNSSHANCDLQPVPGTMNLHQLVADSSNVGKIIYRDISCFCRSGPNKYNCTCFQVKLFSFENVLSKQFAAHPVAVIGTSNVVAEQIGATNARAGIRNCQNRLLLQPITTTDLSLIGQYCVILYNKEPYPGRVLSMDETEAEVLCMHRSGGKYNTGNVFYWPDHVPDKCFYPFENIITIIPEPQPISDHGRLSSQFKIDLSMWKLVEDYIARIK